MRIIYSKSNSPIFNLTAEENLFSSNTEEIVFLYVNKPSVIIGSNQAVENEANFDFCKQNNIQIIKRLSGGGAVYHDEGNLNFSFISNRKEFPLSADFLLPIVEILHSMNIRVEIGKRKDLLLNGYKITGTASHVSKRRELHHGTLLYDTDLNKLQHALTPKISVPVKKATMSVRSEVINIKDFLLKNHFSAPPSDEFFRQVLEKMVEFYRINEPVFLFETEK